MGKKVIKGLPLTILIAGISVCASAKGKNDVAKDKLNGDVKSVYISGYKMNSVAGRYQKGNVIFTSSSKYNESGYIQEFITSAIDDTLAGEPVKYKAVKILYKYDAENNLVGKNEYSANGSLEDSSFYKVDTKGSRVDWYTYKGTGEQSIHTISEYNIHGDLIELTEYVKSKLKTKTSYTYDDQGKQTDEVSLDEKGNIKWKEVLRYNVRGNLVEVTDYKSDDAPEAKFTYTYDAGGYLVDESEYYNDTSLRNKRTTTKYDTKGGPTEMNVFGYNNKLANQTKIGTNGLDFTDLTYNSDGSLKSVTIKKYDDKGNQTYDDRFLTKDSVRVKYEYKFVYDTHNNWTKNTTSQDGKQTQVTERKIEYYTEAEKKKKLTTEAK